MILLTFTLSTTITTVIIRPTKPAVLATIIIVVVTDLVINLVTSLVETDKPLIEAIIYTTYAAN
jgi:hypothetical protein